jgi:DNA-binding beta-propeller fold protein YncE
MMNANWLQPMWRRTKPLQKKVRRRRTSLHVEPLEDRTQPSSLINVPDHTDLVFDSSRNLLYIARSDGKIERYDVVSQTLLNPWTVGTSLVAADITPDNNFLYATTNQISGGQGFICKVDLTNGQVTNLPYGLGSQEAGGWDIAIGANGQAFFDTRFLGSGGVGLRQIDLATDAITVRMGVPQDTFIARGADRSFFDLQAGGVFLCDAAHGTS